MASRESYSIGHYWKYPRREFKNEKYYKRKNIFCYLYIRILSLGILLERIIESKWKRKMFWVDNFTRPYNKLIGCRITKHKWFYIDDDEMAFCTKCYKKTGHMTHSEWKRHQKLHKIKKRIKK